MKTIAAIEFYCMIIPVILLLSLIINESNNTGHTQFCTNQGRKSFLFL